MRQIQELQSSFRQNASLFSDEHRRHMEMTSTANELRSIGNLTPKTLETPTIQISNTEESTARKESFSTLGFSDWAYQRVLDHQVLSALVNVANSSLYNMANSVTLHYFTKDRLS